jgi:hypothetical protein
VASNFKAAGRRSLVIVAVTIVAASFGVNGASASQPLKNVHVVPQQLLGLWDGPGR